MTELKETLKRLALTIPHRSHETVARLPIDRSFSVKGFGAVVTGTLVAGEIKVGEEMEILPSGKRVRVRGVQTHSKTVETAQAGQRTAINLGGIENSEIERGNTLAPVDTLRPTQIFDAEIEVLAGVRKSLKSRARVRVHLGTVEALARVQVLEDSGEIAQGEKGFVQFRLETPVVAVPGERFIIRSYSPQMTIAGGQILDGLTNKHRRRDLVNIRRNLEKLREGERETQLKVFLETAGEFGLNFQDLRARTGWIDSILRHNLQAVLAKKSVIETDRIYLSRNSFESLVDKTFKVIAEHHRAEPLVKGMMRETLREKVFARLPLEVFKKTLQVLTERGEIVAEKDLVRAATYSRNLSPNDRLVLEKLQKIYQQARLEVPTLDTALSEATLNTKSAKTEARKVFQLLLDSGEIVKVTEDFYFSQESITKLAEKLKDFANKSSDKLIDVPTFKELAGISRKYAIPLLEYFDRKNITRRAGDKRLIICK